MKVIVCHVRNEEYLLQWWLPHHKNKFDHGIIIDYHSTDRTHELIHQHCPTWQIIPSQYPEFGAADADLQVAAVEQQIYSEHPNAWVIALNVTEFLIGDTSVLDSWVDPTQLFVPCSHMIDSPDTAGQAADPHTPLHKQRTHGIVYERYTPEGLSLHSRGCRLLHNYPIEYTLGRHYWEATPYENRAILWWGFSPYTPELLERKLQIQNNIPLSDKNNSIGWEHICDKAELDKRLAYFQTFAGDIKEYIERFES